MTLALAALIIALASLLWNIISTVYSWKFSKPAIRIVASPRWTGDEEWLVIDVQNIGGSAIAVKEVDIFWWFVKGRARNNPMRGARLRKLYRRITRDYKPRPIARSVNDPEIGPSLPHTIQPYNSQEWSFDADRLIELWRKSSKRPKKFLIRVGLATGRTATEKVEVDRIAGLVFEEPGPHDSSTTAQ